MQLGVSVIICTFNGSNRLPETLAHLARQEVASGILWEIILIDNASTDHTLEIAEKTWKAFNSPIDILFLQQPIPGKNFAFDKGISAARYEYILTCDDDNWLLKDYITTAFNILKEDDEIGALGGCGILELEEPVNSELADYKINFVHGSQHWAATDHWVCGAGSLYRKSILTQLKKKGWQQVTTGRLGSSLICGEDVEICFMLYLSGYKIVADDRLVFKHFTPQKRQTADYLIHLRYWLAYTNVLLNTYFSILHNDSRPLKKVLDRWLLGISRTLFKYQIIRYYQKLSGHMTPDLEEQLKFQTYRGTFAALLHKRSHIVQHHKHLKNLLHKDGI